MKGSSAALSDSPTFYGSGGSSHSFIHGYPPAAGVTHPLKNPCRRDVRVSNAPQNTEAQSGLGCESRSTPAWLRHSPVALMHGRRNVQFLAADVQQYEIAAKTSRQPRKLECYLRDPCLCSSTVLVRAPI